MGDRLSGRLQRVRRFFTDDSVAADDGPLHRVLGRDAVRAFGVLTRDHPEERRRHGLVGRVWDRTRRLFFGLSAKLSPSRRVLFVIAIALALVGLSNNEIVIGTHEMRIVAAPLLLVLSIACLVFLLGLELADRVVVRDELELARQLHDRLLAKLDAFAAGEPLHDDRSLVVIARHPV